ncbi:hypothetical protein L8N14_015310, partial [Serratia marcescens]|nr:hypothetical protein [Serratia marcescens]
PQGKILSYITFTLGATRRRAKVMGAFVEVIFGTNTNTTYQHPRVYRYSVKTLGRACFTSTLAQDPQAVCFTSPANPSATCFTNIARFPKNYYFRPSLKSVNRDTYLKFGYDESRNGK